MFSLNLQLHLSSLLPVLAFFSATDTSSARCAAEQLSSPALPGKRPDVGWMLAPEDFQLICANFYFIPLVWYSLKLNFSNLGHHNFFAAEKNAT